MSPGIPALRAAAARVAAAGTDPEQLATVVAAILRPGRSPDALRRRCRQDATGELFPASVIDRSPAGRLAAAAGPPAPGDVRSTIDVFVAWASAHVRVALVGDPAYPPALAQGWPDLDAPPWLAWRGEPPMVSGVAIVGARRASSYGTGVAAWLAEAVADAGAPVVSGGAVGIDAAAHEAAVQRPGGTSVVLGSGHLVDYPRQHARPGGLFERVLEHGGSLVGEALPDASPRPHRIRARNRIVAGLASAVVVVEGGDRSGALLTAGAAAERGRPVLAVPGDVRAVNSAAPHRLLAEGAAPCTSPAELLTLVGADAPQDTAGRGRDGARHRSDPVSTTLPAEVHAELVAAWPRPLRSEDLARRCGQSVGSLLAALTRARINAEVAESADGIRLCRPPRSIGPES